MRLVDTHCHLSIKKFNKDREETIARAKEKLLFLVEVGVNHMVNEKAIALSEKHKGFVFPSLGLHPSDATTEELKKVKEQIEKNSDKIIAIGETGLDYYHIKDREKRKNNEKIFRSMLELSEKTDKPVIVHSREAEKECLDILSSFNTETIMHSFSDKNLLEKCLERDYWVSVSTVVQFAKDKQEIVKSIGLDKLLLETDSPFLSPFKKIRNEPINVTVSAKKISNLLKLPYEMVVEKTTRNAMEALKYEKLPNRNNLSNLG